MKIKSAVFETSATDVQAAPRRPLAEFALIGRSNVGKSSLVNLLTNRRDLARTSNTPGKTQLINFFVINDAWRLVDLPGYGYAKVERQQRLEFNQAVAKYLTQREALRRVFVLIDSRLPPQPIDLEFLRWLEGEQVPYSLVFTKVDKHSATQAQASVDRFMATVGTWRSEPPDIVLSSSETGAGRSEILAHIDAALSTR